MVNSNLVKAKMAQHGASNFSSELAALLNISKPNASLKLRGKTPWRYDEIELFAARYNLTASEFLATFFPKVR